LTSALELRIAIDMEFARSPDHRNMADHAIWRGMSFSRDGVEPAFDRDVTAIHD